MNQQAQETDKANAPVPTIPWRFRAGAELSEKYAQKHLNTVKRKLRELRLGNFHPCRRGQAIASGALRELDDVARFINDMIEDMQNKAADVDKA